MTGIDPNVRARASGVSFGHTNATQNARHGQIGDHRVALGTGAKTPSRASEAGKAIAGFFRSVGTGIKSFFGKIATAYKDYKADREFTATRTKLESQLPAGITVDKEGNVGGTFVTSNFPTSPSLGNNSGKSFAQTMQSGSVSELTDKVAGKKTTEVPTYDGIRIAHQAKSDFYRMDMSFGTGQGNFDVRRDVNVKGEDERNRQVVQGLRAFTGSDNATSILSTVLTQNLSRPILECFSHSDGSRKEMAVEQGKIGGPFHVRDQNGTLQQVEPGGIGNLKVSVEHGPNGDYKVTGHWEMFLRGEGRGFDVTDFHGMDGALIRADGQITMLIDAHQADNGVLAFVTPPTVNVDLSGKMSS
jgi:hypothetical protein